MPDAVGVLNNSADGYLYSQQYVNEACLAAIQRQYHAQCKSGAVFTAINVS